TVTHWNCDLSDKCNGPSTPGGTAISITGIASRVKAIMLGGEVNGRHLDGLVNRFMTNTGTFEPEELTFLANTRLPVAAFLRNLADKRIVPTQMVDSLSEYIARAMLQQWTYETIAMVRNALAHSDIVA